MSKAKRKTSKPAKRPIASFAVVPPPVPETFYAVSVWDHEAEGWVTRRTVRKWHLPGALRDLYAAGYDTVSILVERLEIMDTRAIHTIEPYRVGGGWFFDDPAVGLDREPLVLGIPEIIESVVGVETPRFRCAFSGADFEGRTHVLTYLREGSAGETEGGHWYGLKGTVLSGWLCPALFKYFDKPPVRIYLKVEVPREEADT